MDITFLGHSAFKIRGKDAVVLTDPFDPKVVGLRYPKVEADIVTISHKHSDHNFLERVEKAKMVISGPGEYEISSVSIMGVASFHDDRKGELRGKNTIFVFEIDGLRIAHLGDLGHRLGDKILEDIGSVDILMIPVGGIYTIGSRIANEIVRDIEPTITIPMHYKVEGINEEIFGKLEKVDNFLSDIGLPVEKIDKLSIKKVALSEEDKKVVVLEVKS